ncbi:MAG: Sapep family Mn(2+)-dependent dipeptidase [Enterococcus sp.]
MMTEINHLIEENKMQFYQDLNRLMEVRSVKGKPNPAAPFGEGPKEVLETIVAIAEEYGFQAKIVKNAVAYVQVGEGDDYIGIVGHLDVVPEGDGWSFPPFHLSKNAGRLYGRGILDNKGPIFSCLFGLKLLMEQNVSIERPIRIIFGTDEESGSADIPLYLSEEQPPYFGFTPDCKYPVVYGERGIVNYEIRTHFTEGVLDVFGEVQGDQARDHVPDKLTVEVNDETIHVIGKRAPSNAPELGENAITLLAEKICQNKLVQGSLLDYFTWIQDSLTEKHHGEGLGIDFEDEDSGKLMITPYQIMKEGQDLVLSVAIRYPVSVTEERVTKQLAQHIFAESTLTVMRRMKSTHYSKEDLNVKKLSDVYESVTGMDGTPVTTTGATYARFMPNTVAFGPSFPGQKGIAHNKDEYMDEADLLLNMEIYMRAMTELTKR